MSNVLAKATSILVQNLQGQVLAASRRGEPNKLGLIGGKQDEGETIEQCAMREFFEETGVCLTKQPIKVFSDVCEAGADGRAFEVTTFKVVDKEDLSTIQAAFNAAAAREIEKGIFVGFFDKEAVLAGPFGKYNMRLFNAIGE